MNTHQAKLLLPNTMVFHLDTNETGTLRQFAINSSGYGGWFIDWNKSGIEFVVLGNFSRIIVL